MSTPSIATQTLPAHQSQYAYTAQNPYSASARQYPANNSLPAPRLATSYQSYPSIAQYSRPPMSPASYKQPSHISSVAPSHSASEMDNNRRKPPDWQDFYKNGVPKEIIVIDDDSPGPQQQQQQQPTRNDIRQQRQEGGSYPAYAGRKRKVDQGYEVEYNDSPTYSSHPAKFGASSSSGSYHSNDRTTSQQTVTAPTSLESYGSAAASNSYEDVRVGQKRKRVQPPKETRASTKKKQQESVPDAFADYVPPPKPLQKAKEVPVPVIRDNLHKHQKTDDDDGHYIVQPNTVMTERCK